MKQLEVCLSEDCYKLGMMLRATRKKDSLVADSFLLTIGGKRAQPQEEVDFLLLVCPELMRTFFQ